MRSVELLAPRHDPILETARLRWADEAATAACCSAVAGALRALPAPASVFVALDGPLGAGKTTFVRHLLRALGVTGRIKSPTYAVVEPHDLPDLPHLPVSHFDFYRFDDPREWEDAGFRELFAAPGLKLAEWSERVAAALPPADLRLALLPLDDGGRDVRADATSPVGVVLLHALASGATS